MTMRNSFGLLACAMSILFSGCAPKSDLMRKDHKVYLKTVSKDSTILGKTDGIVRKVINAQGISYVKLQRNDQNVIWVALIDKTPNIGEKLSIDIHLEKYDFYSKVLNRQFKRIIFATISKDF